MNCPKCEKALPNVDGKIRCSCGEVIYGKSRGLGDTIERVIATVIGNTDCRSCAERRDAANALFPYKT